MEIIKEFIDACTFEQFADKHGLVMRIGERPVDGRLIQPNARYYASFKGVEVAEGSMLASKSGDGATPEAAIVDYARRLVGKQLVVGAYTPSRREIQCPNEWLES